MKKVLIYIFFLILCFPINGICLGKKSILIINSYDPTYVWTKNIENSLTNILYNYKLYIEYMDTKRFPVEKMLDLFFCYLNEKYKNLKIDLIIVSDNNALNFIIKYRETSFFRNIPVVFCGINRFRESMLKGYKDITGVVEKIYFNQVVELILKIQPEIKKLVVIMDATLSNQMYLKDIENIKKEYANKVDIEIINGKFLGINEFTKKLTSIPQNSAIILLTLLKLKDGTTFSFKSGINYIFRHTSLPIYGVLDIDMNMPGVVGGVITSSTLQGEYAAHFARQILDVGVPIQIIPILDKSPTQIVLDYRELRRFHINFKNIPPGAKLLNSPPSMLKLIKEQKKRIVFLEVLIVFLVLFFLLFIFNLFAKRGLQKELLEKNFQLNTIINGSDDIISLKDGENRLIVANEAYINLFGLHNYEYIGKSCKELAQKNIFFKDVFLESIESDEITWQSGKPNRYLRTLEFEGGKKRVFDVIKTPIFDSLGNRKYLIIIARDITEYKELENKLVHSQKMELLGIIAGGIAHDFNNIIAALMMNAELLKLKVKEDAFLKYIDNIIKGLNAASDLVKKIKLMSIKEEVKFEPIDFKDVIDRTITLTKPVMSPNILLNLNFDKQKTYMILGNISQLSQVMMNLILNARDAIIESKKEKGNINIKVEEKGNNLFVYIEDNGAGILGKDKDKIFEPFYTTKTDLSQRGTGLGLSITKTIIEEHGGSIDFKSISQQGTTFVLSIPLLKGNFKKDNQVKLDGIKDELKGKTVLIIDDEEDILSALEEMLKLIGMNVILAQNGKQGIEILDKYKEDIHIIFIDWKMPILDGKETIKKIRDKEIDIPIFIVSGYIDEDIMKFKRQKIVSDVISKPFTQEKLIYKLNLLI